MGEFSKRPRQENRPWSELFLGVGVSIFVQDIGFAGNKEVVRHRNGGEDTRQ